MKQENLQKLLSLVSNYVEHVAQEEEQSVALEEIQMIIRSLSDLAKRDFTDEEKAWMYSETVAALNCGSEEAEEKAFMIRLRALTSGDDELIEKIEYLHEVI
jgi:hemerythrin